MVEAGENYQLQKRLGAQLGGVAQYLPPHLVKLSNETGDAQALGSVLKIGAPALTTVIKGYPWFEGDLPTLEIGTHHAVLLGAMPDAYVGFRDAQIAGVVQARVNVVAIAHRFALPTLNETYLTSSPIGPYRILTAPSGTGEELLHVALEGGDLTVFGKADAEIAENGGTGVVSVWTGLFGSQVDSTQNTGTTQNRTGIVIESGKWAKVSLIDWRLFSEPWECPTV